MKKLFFTLSLAAVLLADGYTTYGGVYVETGEEHAESHFEDVLSSLDLDHTIESIKIDWSKWGMCKGPLYNVPGFEMCYDEPVAIADYSMMPGDIHSLGISIGTNPEQAGWMRFGNEEGLNKFGYTNLVYFPLFGMIIDSDEMCFEKGDLAVPYISRFDPTYDGMYSGSVFFDIVNLFNVNAILLGAVDCAAASTAYLSSLFDTTRKKNDEIRMTLMHYIGCWNTFPMGGWSHNPDPILQAGTGAAYSLAMLTRAGLLLKTAEIDGYDGGLLPDTMCGPKETPVFVKPQWLFNLAYPKPSSVVPLGAVASEWAEFKNSPESIDDVSFWVHQRKCFWFGAAACSRKGN